MFGSLSRLSVLVAGVTLVSQAASPVGSMTSSGAVKISGTEVRAAGVPSWPVLAGDEIATDSDGLAVVSSPATGRLEIRANSKVTLASDHVNLEKGVVGSEKLPVHWGDYTVSAKESDSSRNWFVVADREGEILVAAHRGDVLISRAGAAPLLLLAGSYAMPAGPTPRKEKEKKDDNDRKKRGGAATAGSAAGWTIGSLSHAASVALAVGVTAAAATGTAVGFAAGDDNPPPVRSAVQ